MCEIYIRYKSISVIQVMQSYFSLLSTLYSRFCPLFAYTLDLFPPTDFMLYYPLRMSPITPVLPFSSLSAGAHHSFTHKNIFALNLHTQHCFYLSFLFILQRSLSCCGLRSVSSWYITILLTVYFVTLMQHIESKQDSVLFGIFISCF